MKIPLQDITDAISIIMTNKTLTRTEIETLLQQHFQDKQYDTSYYLQLFIDALGYTFMQTLSYEQALTKLTELSAALNNDYKKVALALSRQICPLAMDFLYEPVWIIDNQEIIYHTTNTKVEKIYKLKQELATIEANIQTNYTNLETEIQEIVNQNPNLTANDVIQALAIVNTEIQEYLNLLNRKEQVINEINTLIGA